MTILDEPSDSQDERSPLKKDVEINTTTSSAALATAPPPYTSIASIPTPSPNPIPSSQAIPQTDPHSPHVILLRRRSPIRRFLVAFLVAWLVLFLWSALVHSFNKAGHFLPIGRRHSYEYEVVRLLPSLCPWTDDWLLNGYRKPLIDGNSNDGLTIQVAFYQSNTLPFSFPKWRNRSSLKSVSISPPVLLRPSLTQILGQSDVPRSVINRQDEIACIQLLTCCVWRHYLIHVLAVVTDRKSVV